MRETKIKKRILIIAIVLLTYPLFEYFTPIRMAGSVQRAELVSNIEKFTVQSWFDGTYQESVMNYMNDQIGLFPFFIRVHNQLEYSLFGNVFTGNVVKGKENYLFEQGYLDAHFGKDFSGLAQIEENTILFKELQDTLRAMDKHLLFLMATNKTNYYPEYIPLEGEVDSTNYDFYIDAFERHDINYVNFNPWFLQMKDSMQHLLFPKYGIHWSHYSTFLVVDSLVKFYEVEMGWDLPDLKITELNYSEEAKYYDNDIAHSLNLFKEIQGEPMIYPEFEWEKPKKDHKKILIIGDSFTWDIFEYTKLAPGCFDKMQFWFYNQTVHTDAASDGKEDKGLPKLTRHLSLHDALMEYDAFLVISNAPNLINMGWGFQKEALLTLEDPGYIPRERNNIYLRSQSKKKKEWREEMKALANERGIELDSMISVFLHDRNYKPEY